MIRPDGLTHGALAEQLIEAPRTPQRILTEDIDVDTPAPAPHRGRELDIEDALDEVGGLGRYQIGHFLACGIFWFAQSGILVSVFVNTAWEDRYRELNAARWWSECRWLWSVPVWGWISDKYGRKAAFVAAIIVLNVSQLMTGVAMNEWFFMFARHLNGIAVGTCSLTVYVLGTEYCPRSYATRVKAGWSFFSIFGNAAFAMIAKGISEMPGYNWRVFIFLMAIPLTIASIISPFVVDESIRWTLVNKGEAAALVLLKKVARRNGVADYICQDIRLRAPDPSDMAGKGKDSAGDLCSPLLRSRTLAIMLMWFAAGFSYYGLTLRVDSLAGDVYYNYSVMSLVEAPALIATIFMVNSAVFGRKWGTLTLFVILGSCSIVVIFWSTSSGRLILNVLGRAAVGSGFSAVYLWSNELFPTSVRHSGMGLGSLSARVGSVAAPWARVIADRLPVPEMLEGDVPLLLFGASAIVAGTTALVVLPETRGQLSPETVADASGRASIASRRPTLEERKDARRVRVATSILGLLVASGTTLAVGFALVNPFGIYAGPALTVVAGSLLGSLVALCVSRLP